MVTEECHRYKWTEHSWPRQFLATRRSTPQCSFPFVSLRSSLHLSPLKAQPGLKYHDGGQEAAPQQPRLPPVGDTLEVLLMLVCQNVAIQSVSSLNGDFSFHTTQLQACFSKFGTQAEVLKFRTAIADFVLMGQIEGFLFRVQLIFVR